MTQTEIYLTDILGKVLRGEPFDSTVLSSGINFADILECARKHSVLHLVYNSLLKHNNENIDKSAFMLYEMNCVHKEVSQSYAWSEFEECAEKNGVNILMLKGIYLKRFYPEPEHREMCDIDILYDPKQAKELERTFLSLGYKKGKVTTCHIGWFNPKNGVTFEAHHILNSQENKKLSYYKDLRKRANNVDGRKHIFCMTNEDLYVHLLLHIRSHLKTKSVMLKQLADLYIMKINTNLDWKKINGYLKELNLVRLADYLDRLIVMLFENHSDSINESGLLELADYIFGNLSFGDFSHAQAQEAAKSGGSKLKALLNQIFPKAEKIYNNYPFLARHRYLLPLGYIYRILQSLGSRKNNRKKKLKIVAEVSTQSAKQGEKINDFFAEYGIV